MEKWFLLAGRIFFSAIFIMSGIGHITMSGGMARYAFSMGVPAAKFMVIVSGLMILFGGIMVLLGWMTAFGAWLIIIFLIPVTLFMHRPLSDQMQMIMFMKNLAMIGGALFIAAHGPGDLSLDKRRT